MVSIRTTAALVGVSLLAACSNSMNPPANRIDRPVQGALAPAANEEMRATQMSVPMRNSDNKPMDARSGLNSDPSNPNGVPGRSQM